MVSTKIIVVPWKPSVIWNDAGVYLGYNATLVVVFGGNVTMGLSIALHMLVYHKLINNLTDQSIFSQQNSCSHLHITNQ